MSPEPLVSIVVPVFNDAETLAAAIESALAQTLSEIEVICVDDASTDASASIVSAFAARDRRVRLVRQPRNLSALQARRAGILAARGEYILFLDGDDELATNAARAASERARATRADVVGFGVTVIGADGRSGGSYERRLQPSHTSLEGAEVLRGLFPMGEPAQGQLWRYLFTTRVLRDAYALLPEDLSLTRVNDLPLMFLVAATATRYASLPDRLYRYHLGRGGSGHRVDSLERAQFYTAAIDSIDSIRPAVLTLTETAPDPALVRESHESVRAWIIAYVTHQIVGRSDSTVLDGAVAHLLTQASEQEIVRASLRFLPESLSVLRFHLPWRDVDSGPKRSVVLATSTLRTGGVTAVLLAQARYLHDDGMSVTIVARKAGSDRSLVPPGVEFVELTPEGLAAQLSEWATLCRERQIDVVIDHQILYTNRWPEFALVSRAEGAATIGWIHNFVGRPVYDGSDRLSVIEECGAALARVVALSPLDVSYLKLRGLGHSMYAPNPPSRFLLDDRDAPQKTAPRGRIELVWWGRLEEHTKKISELVEVADELSQLGVDYRLRIIGPGWEKTTPETVNAAARARGLGDRVLAIGPLHGTALIDAVDTAHAFVSTSIIEGDPLTITEAQSRGLPVFMYELPWLVLAQDNDGLVTAPQADARALALRIAELVREPDRYAQLSASSRENALRALTPDFASLYRDITTGVIDPELSPEPTLDDASDLLRLMRFYAEHSPARNNLARGGRRFGERMWRSAEPAGRAILQRLPGLRPFAHRTKRWMTGR